MRFVAGSCNTIPCSMMTPIMIRTGGYAVRATRYRILGPWSKGEATTRRILVLRAGAGRRERLSGEALRYACGNGSTAWAAVEPGAPGDSPSPQVTSSVSTIADVHRDFEAETHFGEIGLGPHGPFLQDNCWLEQVHWRRLRQQSKYAQFARQIHVHG